MIHRRLYGVRINGMGGLFLADVSDPRVPQLLAKINYPAAATHNAWPTEAQQFILTTDEVSTARNNLKIWNAHTPGFLRQVADTIMGIRARTQANGPFNLVVISGRPYRLDANALRTNMTIIINDWFGLGTAVETPETGPESFALLPNYPNPFTPAIGTAVTQIVFSLPQRGKVQLEIFNVLGQRVRELLNARREQGQHAITGDGTNDAGQGVAAGVYVLRLRAGKLAAERKLTLVR